MSATPQPPTTEPPAEQRMIRILIADDHPLTRDGVRACLAHSDRIEIVGEASDGEEALDLVRRFSPDIVLMDVNMPRLNGMAATILLLRENPTLRVLFLTMHEHVDFIVEIMRCGARGCVLKGSSPLELIAAVEKVAAGETSFGGAETARYLRRYHPAAPCEIDMPLVLLTEREQQVIRLVGEGFNNREIGQRLGVALRTVETYRERLMRKLDLHDAASLRAYAAANLRISSLES